MKRLLPILLLLAATSAQSGDAYLARLSLVDQDGRRVDLYEDLIRNRTVVINSFFASCTASCPVMARTFLHLQSKLGDRVGNDVNLISITVDPENDTPEKLKAYARKVGAKRGWYFLTGTRAEVDAALRRIGQATETREGHLNVIIAGNDHTGLWKKALAIAPTDEIWRIVASVADDRGGAPTAAEKR